MKYIDEFRNSRIVKGLAELIRRSALQEYSFMEVCGGHTAAIRRFGIPSLLPDSIRLLSGPGCPVCVTGQGFIDRTVSLARRENSIVAVFGDLMRIPGSSSTLEKERQAGADIRMVFSGLEALDMAEANPGRDVIFPGIGFETTAPGTAATIKEAKRRGIKNLKVISAHKVMPPAMKAIISAGVKLNGFICPGHVAAITGTSAFSFIPSEYNTGCVISGFEPADILQSVYMLVMQVNGRRPSTEIQYTRVVSAEGNLKARRLMEDVFEPADADWRGLGRIPLSGLKIRQEYSEFDGEWQSGYAEDEIHENPDCICGDILGGVKVPSNCKLFGKSCTPENPVGACMVSAEGSCNSWFKYGRNE
jgi:hydrogenase expression/formation protein HypD